MSDFNFNKYLKNNPLLKETSGYGNYTRPETMLEDNDYISSEEYDNMTDDEIDAAELEGRLVPRDKPLGPDEELMEDEESGEKDSKVKKQVIEKLSQFFDVSASALNKFKFDGTDDIKQLTKALGGTSSQGVDHVVRIAISSAKRDL
jgi:hypothetical protein